MTKIIINITHEGTVEELNKIISVIKKENLDAQIRVNFTSK